MRSSRALIKLSINLFDEGAGDHTELSFGVVRAPDDNDTIVEQSFVADLGEKYMMATQGR